MATLKEKLEMQVQNALTKVAKDSTATTAQSTQPNTGTIDLGAVANTPKLSVPQMQLQTVNQGIQGLTTGTTQAEQNQQDVMGRIMENQQRLGQRASVSNRIGEQLNIGDAQTRAREASNTVGQISTQMQQAPLVIQEEAAGRGQTRFTTDVRESDAQRLLAIKGLTAIGEYDVASRELESIKTEQARLLDLEFAPLEAEQQALEKFYAMNKDVLQRQDSKQAQNLSVFLDERKRLLDDMKQMEQTKQSFQLNAQANGADAQTVQAIQNAESIEDAIAVGGNYIQDPMLALQKQQITESIKSSQFNRNLAQQKFNFDVNQAATARINAIVQAQNEQQIAQEVDARVQDTVVETIDEKLNLINSLLENTGGLQNAVGTGYVRGFFEGKPGAILSGKLGNFNSDLRKLVGQETFAELARITENSSLGAISEGELALVASSATQIGDEELLKSMSEEKFISVLGEMSDNLLRAKQKAYQSVVPLSDAAALSNALYQ